MNDRRHSLKTFAAGTFGLATNESRWMGPGLDEVGYPPADSPFKRDMLFPGIRALKRAFR